MDEPGPKSAAGESAAGSLEDMALGPLTPEDRERLAMDAWEPTLLRKLLKAQDALLRQSKLDRSC